MQAHLAFIYGEVVGAKTLARLETLIEQYRARVTVPETAVPNETAVRDRTAVRDGTAVFSERDTILITYGDQVQSASETPLQTLASFCTKTIEGLISGVHILPFYPYSSDDGFSVIDYKAVDPNLGSWAEIAALGRHFDLMFDAVINHISVQSRWFQRFLRDEAPYRDFFTVVDPKTDLSSVFRPRALPLLTPFETAVGVKHVWTTFSSDQVDLNYANPDVLLAVIDTLLFYVAHGARYIRLDAIGFMWKEIGTSSLHLPQTHRIIQLMREILNEVAPDVVLITETNVPHVENISYFGDGANEAQMVYNFSLPPLTLHAFHTGNAETLSRWAEGLTLPSDRVTFFNFLASHDGIGVTPARGILPDDAIAQMVQRVQELGGYVSFKNNADGSQSAYELNINYLDALGDPAQSEETNALRARRFLAAQAIMLALRGVPGIYFHSLFGSRNWREGVQQTGRHRTINRQKLMRAPLETELANPQSLRAQVFAGYRRLLAARTTEPAFHPTADQAVLALHPAVFALRRTSRDGRSTLLCLHNVSNQTVTVTLPETAVPYRDLLANDSGVENGRAFSLNPYQVAWLKANS